MQHLRRNAKLTPASRRLLVERIRDLGWRVTEAAEAAGGARQTAYEWPSRFDSEGELGLEDRSAAPVACAAARPGAWSSACSDCAGARRRPGRSQPRPGW